MRRTLIWIAALAVLLLALPAVIAVWPRPAPPPAPQPDVLLYDDAARVFRSLPLEEYLRGVVGAEMPASFGPEALKAQAVVARTYAVAHLRVRGGPGCAAHPPADVCADGRESQAWLADDALMRSWPSDAARANLARIGQAVDATRGIVATFGGRPIDAVYFAASGGRTEDAQFVWGRSVPYLRTVASPGEGDPYEDVATRLTWSDLAKRLGLPRSAILSQPPARRFVIRSRTPSGRAFEVSVGGRTLLATDLRARLGLRSTWITRVEAGADGLTLHTRGWGHGVGMSQYGAQAMAERGATFEDIIRHYYVGVTVEPLSPRLWTGTSR